MRPAVLHVFRFPGVFFLLLVLPDGCCLWFGLAQMHTFMAGWVLPPKQLGRIQ